MIILVLFAGCGNDNRSCTVRGILRCPAGSLPIDPELRVRMSGLNDKDPLCRERAQQGATGIIGPEYRIHAPQELRWVIGGGGRLERFAGGTTKRPLQAPGTVRHLNCNWSYVNTC
jgi:hypothetical protein